MTLHSESVLFGPVIRIPNKLHVSLFMMFPIKPEIYLNTAPEGMSGQSWTFNANYNFNMLLAVDVYVWKTLSLGLTYVLTGGVFNYKNDNSTNKPAYTQVSYYSHQINVSIGYGFNL
jgi:hypothetical protein